MTIHIPDDLARALQLLAAAEHKSVDQVALETLRSSLPEASTAAAVLRFLRSIPRPGADAVDDLEAAIASARLPVSHASPLEDIPFA
jgi:plasmid stability protein